MTGRQNEVLACNHKQALPWAITGIIHIHIVSQIRDENKFRTHIKRLLVLQHYIVKDDDGIQ